MNDAVEARTSGNWRTRLRAAAPILTIVLTAVVAQACALDWPLMYTDDYVYENAASGSLSRQFNVFNIDLPHPNIALGWWASGAATPVQRRFLRFASSILISAEARVFGFTALPYHLVTLGLHATNCCIAYALVLGWLRDRRKALVAALVPAAHPIGMGVIANMTWQPAAVTAFLMLLSVWAWMRFRRTNAALFGGLSVALTFATMTSYEVGVVVPLLIVGADWYFARGANWWPRLAQLALLPAYGFLYHASHVGIVYPEVSHLRPWKYVWRTLRVDGANYVLKTLLVFDPHNAAAYWLFNKVGEPASWIFLAVVLFPVFFWARKKPAAILALVAWAALLSPPLLTRATVHGLSYPVLRQLYVPLFALPLLVGAALEGVALSVARRAAAGGVVIVECVQSILAASWFPLRAAREAATEHFARATGSTDPAKPLVLLNDARRCSYNPRFDWPDREILRPVPLAKKGSLVIRRVGDDTLDVLAPSGGFALPLVRQDVFPDLDTYEPGGSYVTRWPPPLVTDGQQHVEGAQLTVIDRDEHEVRRLRIRFDRPLSSYVFVDAPMCDKVERIDVSALPRVD
jgi:hypothetical protein